MAQWTIPINITVSIGTPAQAGVAPPGASREDQEGWLFGRRRAALPPPEFDLGALAQPGFHWAGALSCAMASELAYLGSADVSQTTSDWGFGRLVFLSNNRSQGFVAEAADVVLVSFRGTQQLNDWLTNLNLLSTATSVGDLHAGFFEAFTDLQQAAERAVGGGAGKSMVITGHSLGGALALIAAAVWRQSFNVLAVHTFGQPAVGKRNFIDLVSNEVAPYYRFVNDDDIVPRVPPGYRHGGELIQFDSDGDVEEALESLVNAPDTMSEEEFAALQQRLAGTGEAGMESLEGIEEGLLPSFRDHAISRYIQKIQGQLEG